MSTLDIEERLKKLEERVENVLLLVEAGMVVRNTADDMTRSRVLSLEMRLQETEEILKLLAKTYTYDGCDIFKLSLRERGKLHEYAGWKPLRVEPEPKGR